MKLKTIHRSSVLYMIFFFKKKTHLPLLHGFLVLGDAIFDLCFVICVVECVWNRPVGMRSNSALGSVRVGVTEIDVNRMFELLFSMHPFQRETKFFFDAENYFHGSVASSEPFIRKNRFICKLANHSRVKCTACLPVWIIAGFRTPFCYGVQIPLF